MLMLKTLVGYQVCARQALLLNRIGSLMDLNIYDYGEIKDTGDPKLAQFNSANK